MAKILSNSSYNCYPRWVVRSPEFVQSPAEVGYARAPSWPISDDYTHDMPVSVCLRPHSSAIILALNRFAAPASPPSLGPPTQCGSASVGLCARCGSGPSSGHHCWQGLASLSLVAGWAVLTADRTDGPVVCHWVNKWGPLKSGSARAVAGRAVCTPARERACRTRARLRLAPRPTTVRAGRAGWLATEPSTVPESAPALDISRMRSTFFVMILCEYQE